MATWQVRLQVFSALTGGTIALGTDGVADITQPDVGSAHLGVFDDGSDGFIYLDGALTPLTIDGLPHGFFPNDAYTLHHVTDAGTNQDTVNFEIDGVFSHLFTGPVGTIFPSYDDLPLSGMTLGKLTGLLGKFALLSFVVGTNPLSGTGEQSNLIYDPLFTCNLNGTYVIQRKVPPMPSRTPIQQGGGRTRGRS